MSARPTTLSRSICQSPTAQAVRKRPTATPTRRPPRRSRPGAQAGALVDDPEPAIWALTQDYTAPDGSTHTRHGILVRVRVEDYGVGKVRPHERTLPGPKQDRLDLTRATHHNLSPIFSLSTKDAWPLVEPAIQDEPWGEVSDDSGTVNRVWRIGDPAIHAAVAERLADAELLIADGHHRYETARAYRDEVGGEGPHNYTLMALTGLEDPRPLRLPHPPPALRLRRRPRAPAAPRQRPTRAVRRDRGRHRRPSTPPARRESASSASSTPSTNAPCACG